MNFILTYLGLLVIYIFFIFVYSRYNVWYLWFRLVFSGAPEAQPYTIAQGKALAMTAIDLYTSPELLRKTKDDFKRDKERDAASA